MHTDPDIIYCTGEVSEGVVYPLVDSASTLWLLECTAGPFENRLGALEILPAEIIYERPICSIEPRFPGSGKRAERYFVHSFETSNKTPVKLDIEPGRVV